MPALTPVKWKEFERFLLFIDVFSKDRVVDIGFTPEQD
jgi:hypothetical protein